MRRVDIAVYPEHTIIYETFDDKILNYELVEPRYFKIIIDERSVNLLDLVASFNEKKTCSKKHAK